jgi:hypothetical protein
LFEATKMVREAGSAMTGPELLQFEVIRMIAGSLIGLAIVLLWFVAISRQ